jgi:uncharacterized protein YunC (DUF1805 family)
LLVAGRKVELSVTVWLCDVWDREAVVSVAIVAGKVSGVEELEELLTFDRLSS